MATQKKRAAEGEKQAAFKQAKTAKAVKKPERKPASDNEGEVASEAQADQQNSARESEEFLAEVGRKGGHDAYSVVKEIMEDGFEDNVPQQPPDDIQFFETKFVGERSEVEVAKTESKTINVEAMIHFVRGSIPRPFAAPDVKEKTKILVRLLTLHHHNLCVDDLVKISELADFELDVRKEIFAAIKRIPTNLVASFFTDFFLPYSYALDKYFKTFKQIDISEQDEEFTSNLVKDFIKRAPAKLHRACWRKVTEGSGLDIDFEAIFAKTPHDNEELACELQSWRTFLQLKIFSGLRFTLGAFSQLSKKKRMRKDYVFKFRDIYERGGDAMAVKPEFRRMPIKEKTFKGKADSRIDTDGDLSLFRWMKENMDSF